MHGHQHLLVEAEGQLQRLGQSREFFSLPPVPTPAFPPTGSYLVLEEAEPHLLESFSVLLKREQAVCVP